MPAWTVPRFFFGATPMASRKKRERLKKMAWSNNYRRGVFRKGRVLAGGKWVIWQFFSTSTCRNAQNTVATNSKANFEKNGVLEGY